MADLNALIAQGYQFQAPPDPFAQYAKRQQLDLGEQTNQLNQMKMQEYQRGMEETNALRRLDPTSATYLQDVMRISPEKGFSFAKSQQEAKTAGTEGQIKSTKLIADKLALLPDAYRMAVTPEAYLAVHKSVHADPVLGPYLQSLGATPEKGIAQLENAVQMGKFDQLRMGSMQSVSQLLDSMKPVVVGASSSVYDPTKGTFNQAPAAPAAAAKPPEKLEIMRALGYSMDAAGDAAYEEAKRAPPTVAAPPAEISTMNALGIPVTPEGYAYLQQLKTKPVVTAEPTTNEIKNARAIALGAGPEGSVAYNQSLQTQLLRLTDKPITAAAATSTEMKNADAFALLKGPAGSLAYNQEFAKQLARLTAKSEGAAKDDPNTTVASTQVDNAGNVTFYNKFGKPINTQKGAGKPSATFEKTAAAKVNLARDLGQAIAELTAVTKDGGLIDQSTGSGVGRAVDIGARFIGKAMPGDIAIGKLQPVADLALKMVPRFEGPQSNADTTSYKQAAGQLADPTLPPEIRKAAGKTVLRLMIARKGQFTTADIPTEGAGVAPTGVDTRNPLLN